MGQVTLNKEDKEKLKSVLTYLKTHCSQLGLIHSTEFLDSAIEDPPETERELNYLIELIKKEMKLQLFLIVPSDRAKYYRQTVSETLSTSFPKASREIFHAGNCFATGEYTACVFHSMRAAERGLRALAIHTGVTLPRDIDFAEWGTLIDEVDKKVKEMSNLPKTPTTDENLMFCSNAAVIFRHFKNAYRNHVSHSRETYEEDQAHNILDRTKEFLESLATKLSEPN